MVVKVPDRLVRTIPNDYVIRDNKNRYDVLKAPRVYPEDSLRVNINDPYLYRKLRGQYIMIGHDGTRRTLYGPRRADPERYR